VVATTAGGIASAIRDGESGLLVGERDPRALAAAIGAVLDDPDRGARLGRAARATAEAQFGWDAAAARFETAYDRALAFNSLSR